MNDSNGVGFNVFSPDRELKASLGTNGKGEPFLALYGKKNGKLDVKAFMALSDGEPQLKLRDKDGNTLFSAIREP